MTEAIIGSGRGVRQGRNPAANFEFDPKAEPLILLASAIGTLAEAINHLAKTQEPIAISQSRGAVSFSIANFEDQPDGQTAQLREVERKRSGDS